MCGVNWSSQKILQVEGGYAVTLPIPLTLNRRFHYYHGVPFFWFEFGFACLFQLDGARAALCSVLSLPAFISWDARELQNIIFQLAVSDLKTHRARGPASGSLECTLLGNSDKSSVMTPSQCRYYLMLTRNCNCNIATGLYRCVVHVYARTHARRWFGSKMCFMLCFDTRKPTALQGLQYALPVV